MNNRDNRRDNTHGGWREDWLALTEEEILEPELPIVDPHHHLWDTKSSVYMLDDLLADTGSGHNVHATVFVECRAFYRAFGPGPMRFVGETEFVNGVAAMAASGVYGTTLACAGIAGRADLAAGASVAEVLAAHVAAGNGRFRGIRHAAGWDASPEVNDSHTEPPEGLYLDPKFREGFAQLAEFEMSFEAWQYQFQMGDLIDLARAFPAQPIVLNHCGGIVGIGPYAGRHEEFFQQWQADIRELAECPNVYIKLGGLGMKLGGFGLHERPKPATSEELADLWRPYIETCLEAFGTDRGMFESNFPVDKHSCSYPVMWNAFKRLAADCSAEEKAALFHDNARRFYRLELPELDI
jgi:predicted TIM-barrel fold metal-dependent hydrolase